MKEVFNNYGKYKIKAKKLAIVNKTKFTLSAMTIKLGEILEKYLPKFEVQPQKVDLKLPTLKKVSEPKQNLGLPKLKKVGG